MGSIDQFGPIGAVQQEKERVTAGMMQCGGAARRRKDFRVLANSRSELFETSEH